MLPKRRAFAKQVSPGLQQPSAIRQVDKPDRVSEHADFRVNVESL
jgi:hypothetical protein